ncbi:hypothetical protein BO71DRAFT_393121 [Aspergillus ellipticus CBS 707.79]|uniref:CENP-V/GFA domain-containing protein n=1 Tax=Aspergillus ellipticus CBS 707.79 TaxID=1448320 RepID=A0A319CSZ4_9EURO|nr:hypothetical protein BO71DRAFT_393121 [Aspergillus ellipticus CBS 707.79]
MTTTEYKGSCHCGAFRFTLSLPAPLTTAHSCNCAVCAKKGSLWVFPRDNELVVMRGEGGLVGYKAGDDDNEAEHFFCGVCGTGVLVRGHGVPGVEGVGAGVGARALLGVNPFSLTVESFGDKSSAPPRVFPGPLPEIEGKDLQIYSGGCHCGAVSLAVKTKVLAEVEVKEDNCSICQRNANTCIYPTQSHVSLLGEASLTEYRFGRKFMGHRFCKVCSVQVCMKAYGPPQAVVEKLPPATQEMVRKNLEIFPVRVAVLDGVDWDSLVVKRSDEGTGGYGVE